MGKGAFRGSLHFCGQARQSARTRSKRPFPASRRRGSGDRPPHFPAGRQAGRRRTRHSSAPPLSGRPTPVSASDCPPRLPDKQTPALSGRHAPRVFGRPGHRHPTLIRQQPARPRASLRPRQARQTGTPPPHPDSPTTRPGRERGLHSPTDANRDCGIGCRTCKKSAAPDPARRPGLPEKGRKPRIHICIHLPFKFLSSSLASDRGRKPLSFKFMFLLIVDYVS